jgi:hypothetical protein
VCASGFAFLASGKVRRRRELKVTVAAVATQKIKAAYHKHPIAHHLSGCAAPRRAQPAASLSIIIMQKQRRIRVLSSFYEGADKLNNVCAQVSQGQHTCEENIAHSLRRAAAVSFYLGASQTQKWLSSVCVYVRNKKSHVWQSARRIRKCGGRRFVNIQTALLR